MPLIAPPKPPPAKAVIEKRYSELTRAVKSLDGEKVGAWLKGNAAPGFFYRTPSGRSYTAQGMEQFLTGEFATTRAVLRTDSRLTNFSFHPKQVFCTVSSHLVVLLAHDRKVVSDSIAVDTWVLSKGAWKILSIVETSSRNR